jgi:hypothetical protein
MVDSGLTAKQLSRSLGYRNDALPFLYRGKWVRHRTELRVVTLYRLLVRAGRVPPLLELEEAS